MTNETEKIANYHKGRYAFHEKESTNDKISLEDRQTHHTLSGLHFGAHYNLTRTKNNSDVYHKAYLRYARAIKKIKKPLNEAFTNPESRVIEHEYYRDSHEARGESEASRQHGRAAAAASDLLKTFKSKEEMNEAIENFRKLSKSAHAMTNSLKTKLKEQSEEDLQEASSPFGKSISTILHHTHMKMYHEDKSRSKRLSDETQKKHLLAAQHHNFAGLALSHGLSVKDDTHSPNSADDAYRQYAKHAKIANKMSKDLEEYEKGFKENLEEALTIAQRQKRGMIFRRYKEKIQRARELSKRKMASNENIKKRSYQLARSILRKRLAGARGEHYDDLSVGEKITIDKMLDTKKKAIKVLGNRLIPKVKQKEALRLQSFLSGAPLKNHGAKEVGVNESFTDRFEKLKRESDEKESKKTNDGTPGVKNKIKILKSFTEERKACSKIYKKIEEKAENFEIPVDILGEVYDRGLESWGENSFISAEQHAFGRVNSFLNGGKALIEDSDLAEACWKNYKQLGMKKKNGKTVPNCIPEDVKTIDKEPIIIPAIGRSDGTFTPARVVMRRVGRKIVKDNTKYA